MPVGDNVAVPTLDAQIDVLYRLPLAEFTATRTALVKTVRGADATHVRTLAKPTVIAWAVNQVYWRSRPVYDRLLKAGAALRHAQIAALTGKAANLRTASDDHRRALADAVKEAETIAAAAGSHPAADALMRTFEAISLAKDPPAKPGRLVDALQPAGFEALAGVTPAARLTRDTADTTKVQAKPDVAAIRAPHPAAAPAAHHHAAEQKKQAAEAKRRAAEARRLAAEEKKRAASIKKAEAALERAKAKIRAAEDALKRMQERS